MLADVKEMAGRVFDTHALNPAVVAELVRLLPRLNEDRGVLLLEQIRSAYLLCVETALAEGGEGFRFAAEDVSPGDAALLLGSDQLVCFVAVLTENLAADRPASRLEMITAAALCSGRITAALASALVVSIVNKNMPAAVRCAE